MKKKLFSDQLSAFSGQRSAFRCQRSAISGQLSAVSCQRSALVVEWCLHRPTFASVFPSVLRRPQLFFGHLSGEGFVKREVSEATSSLLETETATGQRISADKKNTRENRTHRHISHIGTLAYWHIGTLAYWHIIKSSHHPPLLRPRRPVVFAVPPCGKGSP